MLDPSGATIPSRRSDTSPLDTPLPEHKPGWPAWVLTIFAEVSSLGGVVAAVSENFFLFLFFDLKLMEPHLLVINLIFRGDGGLAIWALNRVQTQSVRQAP